MAKDFLLQEEMGRLEIEPMKVANRKAENPFNVHNKIGLHKRPSDQNTLCACTSQKKTKTTGVCKKKGSKILKEPVLQIIKSCITKPCIKEEIEQDCTSSLEKLDVDPLNLCTLVKTCNQLKISSESKEQSTASTNKNKWWKNGSSNAVEIRESRQHSQTGSCSQQALNPPCDVTIDELASYFETLVHIPKKMSSMAEMMYI